MKLAVIPARGGSKRIPRKNIKDFCGKPMIAWSIIAAIESDCFDQVIVSTDDAEIAEVARRWGAVVPFVRPACLSGDYVGTIPVVRHAIEFMSQYVGNVIHACCLYATAPFVTPEDLRRGLEILQCNDCDYAFSVTGFDFPIQRAIRINEGGRVEMFHPEYMETRSQDLELAFHDAGQFYWGTAGAWLKEKIIFGPSSLPVFLPRYRVQDIDDQEDWCVAEYKYTILQSGFLKGK